jgi:hypothetical membrane protein
MTNQITTGLLLSDQPRSLRRSAALARWLVLLGGVIGPVVFSLAYTIDGALRPGYSPISRAISDLGVGPNATLMDSLAVGVGVAFIGFALGFGLILRPVLDRGWRWAIVGLLAVRGAALIGTAIFTEAPDSVRLHALSGVVGMTSTLGSFLVVGLALVGQPAWRAWGRYSLLATLATLVLIAIEYVAFTPGSPLASAHIAGLMERLVWIEACAWYVAFGWRLFHAGR